MTSNNSLYFLGAAVVGIVSAASLFIAEHLRQERRRHAMAQDLAKLDQQLVGMKKEIEQLRLLQKEKFYLQNNHSNSPTYRSFIRSANRVRRSKHSKPQHVNSLSVTSDDYSSAIEVESSDLEFYDLSDDERDEESESVLLPLAEALQEIDNKLNGDSIVDIKTALDCLEELNSKRGEDVDILWRIAKANHKIGSNSSVKETKLDNYTKGLAACERALNLDSKKSEVHKWYAILIGSRSDNAPIKEKISDGYLFKKHLDLALELNPQDATLYHLLGRFAYETASLKWYERKIAATFFAEPPSGTFEEALEYLYKAEKLNEDKWKENKLLIAKCLLAVGKYKEGVDSLVEADGIKDDLNANLENQIKTLLQKYNTYR